MGRITIKKTQAMISSVINSARSSPAGRPIRRVPFTKKRAENSLYTARTTTIPSFPGSRKDFPLHTRVITSTCEKSDLSPTQKNTLKHIVASIYIGQLCYSALNGPDALLKIGPFVLFLFLQKPACFHQKNK